MTLLALLLLPIVLAAAPPAASAAAEAAGPQAERVRRMNAPAYDPSDPDAPEVTAANLLESARFWPYHVSLTEPLLLDSGRHLPAGTKGVLIRVRPDGETARIDFGRDGIALVAVTRTDLVDGANRKRLGEGTHFAPNLVLALAQRSVDTRQPIPMKLGLHGGMDARGFLLVFSDADGLEALAPHLAPLADRRGVLTLLLPEGRVPDPAMRDRLVALDWRPAYVYDGYAEAYTRSLLAAGTERPAVQLATPDGKLLYESAWSDATPEELAAAIDAGFPEVPGR